MNQKLQKLNSSGFSLIETLVYVSILVVILIAVINTALIMSRSYGELSASRNINSSVVSALERITREVRWAYDVDNSQSTLNVHPGSLTLSTTNYFGESSTVEFYLEDGVLKIKEGGVYKGVLTSPNVQVVNLVFRPVSSGRSQMIKVEITLEGVVRRGRIRSETFYDSVVLRGSY